MCDVTPHHTDPYITATLHTVPAQLKSVANSTPDSIRCLHLLWGTAPTTYSKFEKQFRESRENYYVSIYFKNYDTGNIKIRSFNMKY